MGKRLMLEKPVSSSKFWFEMVAAKWQIVSSEEERATSDRFLTRLRALPLLFFASFFVLSRALRLFAHEGRCENTCRSFCRSAHGVPRNHAIPGFAESFVTIERREEARNYFVHFFLINDQDYCFLLLPRRTFTLTFFYINYLLCNIIFIYPFNFILENR